MNQPIYTHDEATRIVELFEEVLEQNGIIVPSPEDDDREDDNAASLYGSVYAGLLDNVEAVLVELLGKAKDGCDVVPYEYSSTY